MGGARGVEGADMVRAAMRWVATAVMAVGLVVGPCAGGARGQCTAVPAADWKTTIAAGDDFRRYDFLSEQPSWVKFTVLLCDPQTVYFQDSRVHQFHYEFGSQRLRPLLGMSRAAFDGATLHAAGQQAVLGAVLWPGYNVLNNEPPPPNEVAVQLVRQEAYTKEQVRDYVNLVKSRITGLAGASVVYLPTYEQRAQAEADSAWLAQQGIPVISLERWQTGSRAYAEGWAIGTLRYVPAAQIDAAYRSGALKPSDVLLTDGVPAEVPPVAGIVSLSASTPNSHVALLSQTWGVPFVHVVGEDAAAAQAAVGRRVIVRTKREYSGARVAVVDVQDLLAPPIVDQLLALKAVPPLQYQPVQASGVYTRPVGGLTPSDTKFVGGKAANYGLLLRATPANTRPAMAITLDLWNAFLAQTLANGRTLRQEIDLRLGGFAWPPADPAAQATALAGVRALFTDTAQTQVPAAAQAAILAGLQDPQYGFMPGVKIRCRSSSNVEDTATFTGAGLYESFSGCLADELDGDTTGPSLCDAAEANERGIFRAIRRVFASFYYENAFQARRRLGVNEANVGMAVLCHHSFPDPTELANGVVVYKRRGGGAGGEATIVTQLGATSVTNPEDGSLPEQVDAYVSGGAVYPTLVRASNRVVLGDTVMAWETDYRNLAALCRTVAERYALENGVTDFSLDFEFKKTTFSGALELKQVRRLPEASTTPSVTPVLVGRPQTWCVFMGEYHPPDVFAIHRLKTRLTMAGESGALTGTRLQQGFLGPITMEHYAGCLPRVWSGNPLTAPGGTHTFASGESVDSWRVNDVPNPRRYTLRIGAVPSLVPASESPAVWLSDFGSPGRHLLRLEARYDQPVTHIDEFGNFEQGTDDAVSICPCPKPNGLRVERVFGAGSVVIETAFDWVPGGSFAGYTFDLASWQRTTITGLTTRPIVLTSPYAQSYAPGHHNFGELFLFDPRVDAGVPRALKLQLYRANVGTIFADNYTLDGRVVTFPDDCRRCPMDYDGTGAADVLDIFAFLTAWFGGEAGADWDGLRGVDLLDIFGYLEGWFGGC